MDEQRVLSDRYALISHLARGGMADVWVAEDTLLERRVAVKILHGQFASSDSFVERFRREAQAAANVTHASIVAVYDWGQDDEDTYFMVMELVEGRNLRDVLRSEGALLPRRVAEIGSEVATALSVAHGQGLVHRDIKPANILLTPDGSVKVADFGIARAWDDSDQLTRTGAVIGTATYFSPEQAQGQPADARSDIYSLGIVMYELLTASPPFSGESPVAVAYQHVQEEPVRPTQLDPNIPAGLEAIVMKAMAKNPAMRYQSATELSADLQRMLAGQVPEAAPENEAPTRVMAATEATRIQAEQGYAAPPPPRQPIPTYQDPDRPDRTTVVIGVLAALALLGLGVILLIRLLSPSDASATVTVPAVRGMEVQEAIDELEDLDLVVTEQAVTDAEVPAGLATGTTPAAGAEVARSSDITLLVSAGTSGVQVPAVVGLSEEQARATLEGADLEVGEVTTEASETVVAGTVISQDPGPGESVPAGTDIDLIVSAGSGALLVPDVSAKSESDALFSLSQAGFSAAQVRVERRPSADVLERFVIGTDPGAGQAVPEGGIVTLFVSQGAVPTVLPSVIGFDPADAQTLLEDLGFVIAFGDPLDLPFEDPLDELIAHQDPDAGVTADFGSTVTLQIGNAPDAIDVPDTVGDDIATAQQKIEDADLVFAQGDDVDVEFGDPNDGRVAAQDPEAGDPVEPGTTVTVGVGVAPPPTSVPNVTTPCLDPADAQAQIEAAGLVYVVGDATELPIDNPCDGKVVGQNPLPDTEVGEGTDVVVSIGASPPALTLPTAAEIFGMRITDVRNSVVYGEPTLTWTRHSDRCVEVTDASLVDRVAKIEPGPETRVAVGSEIMFWLGVLEGNPCA